MTNKLLAVAIVAACAMGATYGGTGLQRAFDENDLDRVAPTSSRIPGDQTWGGYLKTEEEMRPPLSIRFDDMGSRPDHAIMAQEFLKRGIPISIGVNAWNVAAAESAQIDSILTFEREYGTEVEWYQHTNSSMRPDIGWPQRGVSPRTSGFTLGSHSGVTIPTTDWRYFTAWRWSDWVAELDPTRIIELTGERPTFIVWPGDGSPQDRAFVRRNLPLFEDLLDTLGYEFGLTAFDAVDSMFVPGMQAANPLGSALASGKLQPFMFADYPFSKAFIPFASTIDLTSEFYVERFAPGDPGAPSWVPPGTERFTLAENVTPYSNGTAADWFDFAVANEPVTFRKRYSEGAAIGGGFSLVLHSETQTLALTPATPTYPSGTSNSVTGDWIDVAYIAAACSALVAEEIYQAMTVSEHVKWLSKKPGKPGMAVHGTRNPVFPWAAIGDSAGVETNLIRGFGTGGVFRAYTPEGFTQIGDEHVDTDYDGKLNEWHVGTGNHGITEPKLGFLPGYGRGGRSDALIQHDTGDGNGAWLFYGSPALPPGHYRFEITLQNLSEVRAQNYGVLRPTRYSYRTSTDLPYVYDILPNSADTDTMIVHGNTDVWTAPPRVDVLQSPDTVNNRDQWSNVATTATDFSAEPWWTLTWNFTVPENQDKVIAYERYAYVSRLEFWRAEFDSYPRIDSVFLRWMGPVTE